MINVVLCTDEKKYYLGADVDIRHRQSCHQQWKRYLITVYPKKYAHGFVVLCFVVVMQSFIMNSHEVFIHIHQGCFAGTGAIVRLPQCQWSEPDGYGKINQWITTTKHSKAKTVCIFLGIYCMLGLILSGFLIRDVYIFVPTDMRLYLHCPLFLDIAMLQVLNIHQRNKKIHTAWFQILK